jgi:transcriptional regulator of acetoin/glycerol metabolism
MDSRESASETLTDTEAEQIRRVLAATKGDKSRAAKILGIERKTLYRKLRRWGWGWGCSYADEDSDFGRGIPDNQL